MKNRYPLVLAHISSLANDNKFATPRYILRKQDELVILNDRYCPHRRYPIVNSGTQVTELKCNFHGLSWDKTCKPENHRYKLPEYGYGNLHECGLITENFIMPNHKWVDDISNEKNLVYSHSSHGKSSGSWLWMMEIQADLLHIRKGNDSIHPELGGQTDLNSIEMYEGNGWILQTCSTGWWLFIYPFTFIEWSPGCLSINYTTPNDDKNEFGFEWITQFYYDPIITESKRKEFESLEYVFKQDVDAIEKQNGPYFPLNAAQGRLEDHCVHFGKWVKNNLHFT